MVTQASKIQEIKSHPVAKIVMQRQRSGAPASPFVDNRLEAIQMRKLQKIANNSPQVEHDARLRAIINNHSGQQRLPTRHVIQPKIKIEGGPFLTMEQIMNIPAWNDLTEQQKTAIEEWHESNEVQNFEATSKGSGVKNLFRAAKRSQQTVGQGPALFAKANLRYLTKSPGRTPTLYFQSGATTGRMRTQHDTGPLADIDQYPTARLFSQNKIVNFNGTYMESPGILKNDWTDAKYGHTLVPTDGYH